MTQDITNLNIELYVKEALTVLKSNIVLPGLITTEFDGKATVRGDTVNMYLPATSTPTLNTADAVAYTDHSFAKKTISINQWLYDKKYISDKNLAQALWDSPDVFMEKFIRPMAIGFAEYIDKAIMQLYKDVYYHIGTVDDPPDSIADIQAVYKKFITLKIPKRTTGGRPGWNLVLSPQAYVDFMVAEVLKVNERGNANVADEGEIIRFMGMQVYQSQNLDEATGGLHTAGAWGTTPLTDDATTATGDTDSHADGLTDGAVIKDGDLFTVAEDTAGQYAISADATASSNEADISFAPGMVQTSGWGDSKAITVIGKGDTYINNLAFHPEAFGLAFGSLGTIARNFGCAVEEQREDNIPIRLTIGYDPTKPGPFIMMDTLFGLGTIRPDLAFRIIG